MKVADMHCDTIKKIYQSKFCDSPVSLGENCLDIDLFKMRKGDYLIQNFAMFVDLKNNGNPLEYCLHLIDCYYEELHRYKDSIKPIYSYSDIVQNESEGKMSALLTVEEGGATLGDPAFLRILHRLGVRMMTLTWNYGNLLATSHKDGQSAGHGNGMTALGIDFIHEMESLGMIVDVSHLSDAGFYDVVKYAKKPFVASHSNARSICPHSRNLTDDMIRKLANCGGIMGMNFEPDFLCGADSTASGISQVVAHIKHIVNIGGLECIGLGSDFDGITPNPELKDAAYLPLLEDALLKAGFKTEQVEKIFHGNVMRIYRELF